MFVGHYAAALAAKTAAPKTPLWVLAGACQLLDIGWAGLIMAGVEKMRPDPAAPGGIDLYHMPFSHGLPAAVLWSLAAGLLAWRALRLSRFASVVVGLTVLSHWVLDLLVHGPDLPLGFGGPKVGLGLWSLPIPEMALEMGLVAVAATAWMGRRRDEGGSIWPAVAFVALLVAVQVAASLSPASGDAVSVGAMALGVYLGVMAAAWAVERGSRANSIQVSPRSR
jgi:hypothetical protein